MTSTIDRLNLEITEATKVAKRFKEGSKSPKAKDAFGKLSRLQEQIADITQPFSVEGMNARCGALLAAVKAGDAKRAESLAKRYKSESFTVDAFTEQFDKLVASK